MKFTHKQKQFAKDLSYTSLKKAYNATENGLRVACRSGDKKAMKKAMLNHQVFEYALLYRETPEFNNKRRKHGKFYSKRN